MCGYARAEHPHWPGAAHPIPITYTHFHPGTPAFPDMCSCTNHRERSDTKSTSKTNQVSWQQQPMRKCPLLQSLYVGDKEEGAALWADCCPSQALLPSHSKAIEELVAARSALPFTVIINQAGVTFPAAASFGQHWHSSKPWVRSAEWVPEWLHPSTWLAGRCHPCTWFPLEDAIPACRAACTSTYNRYEFLLQRKYILIMQTLCTFLKHGGKKTRTLFLSFCEIIIHLKYMDN